MRFERETTLPCLAEDAFRWHAREGAFDRLAPPWSKVETLSPPGGLEPGTEVLIKLKKWGLSRLWRARIESCSPGKSFEDIQLEGPFSRWKHTHSFANIDESNSRLRDAIECRAPGGSLVNRLTERLIRGELDRVFRYRHAITERDLGLWSRFRSRKRLRILVSGGYGFIGRRTSDFLKAQGHTVAVLTRSPKDGDVGWNPERREVDIEGLDGFDAVLHLAGENLADGRWNEDRKRRLRASRVDATLLLADALGMARRPPETFICASGIGYYGDRGDEFVGEADPVGGGFLAELCQSWESAAGQSRQFADRVLLLRTGVVLDAAGGALGKMLPPFKFGLGGPLGNGRQWMPWISLEDWIGAVYCLLMGNASGAFNLVAPNPVTNKEFGSTLASLLNRPAVLPVPATLLQALFGEFAREGLLSSCRARPDRLLSERYEFLYPDIGDALAFTLGLAKSNS